MSPDAETPAGIGRPRGQSGAPGGLLAGLPVAWRDGRRIVPRLLRHRARTRQRPSLLATLALGLVLRK